MKKSKTIQKNRGMTYVELIVVLSIFTVMTSVVLFNYGAFQAKVDIKNLASDIALKIVEAQKSALAGSLTSHTVSTSWKPAYGLYLSKTVNPNGADNKKFIYFADLNNDFNFNDPLCTVTDTAGECLDKITITKGSFIYGLDAFGKGDATLTPYPLNDLTLTFTRPNSGAKIISTTSFPLGYTVAYVQITLGSPNSDCSVPSSSCAKIIVYPWGRIEIK